MAPTTRSTARMREPAPPTVRPAAPARPAPREQTPPLLRLGSAAGNRAVAQLLAPGAVTVARQAAGPAAVATDWAATPNLRGAPPVRDRHRPPNTGVVEDEAQFAGLIRAAEASLERQRQRARGYLDERGHLRDYRYFFAKVYSYVTENELAFCRSRAYYYPTYVLRCVLGFEKLYDDNVRAFDKPGARVEDHWRQAFETTARAQQRAEDAYRMLLDCRDPGGGGGLALNAMTQSVLGATQALTASMKAHIRFDLPRAEQWVFNQHYRAPGVRPEDFGHDFMSMSGVFDRAGEAMIPDMADKLGVPVDLVPRMLRDASMSYLFGADMATERADTWRRALALAHGHPGEAGPYRSDARGELTGDATTGDHLASIGGLSPAALRPSLDAPMDAGDDDRAHADLGRLSDGAIAALPAIQRVQYLRALQRGVTGGGDERLILRVLRASPSDLVLVVDAADAWDLLFALDGGDRAALRSRLRSSYYGSTAPETAIRLMRRCLDGETAEWEEEMVADILVDRADRVALVARLGREYPDAEGTTDFGRGLDKLEWQLDGADETRVHRALGR